MADFDFDMILAGHTHDLWMSTRKKVVPVIGKNKITFDEKKITFINTGSFMSTYTDSNIDTWASRSVFSPQRSGVARIDFYLKRNKNHTRYIDCHVRL